MWTLEVGVGSLGFNPMFCKKIAHVLAPKLANLFRTLIATGAYPDCWHVANINPIPKVSSTLVASEWKAISLTPVFSRVLDRLVVARLSRYMEVGNYLSPTQVAY